MLHIKQSCVVLYEAAIMPEWKDQNTVALLMEIELQNLRRKQIVFHCLCNIDKKFFGKAGSDRQAECLRKWGIFCKQRIQLYVQRPLEHVVEPSVVTN